MSDLYFKLGLNLFKEPASPFDFQICLENKLIKF